MEIVFIASVKSLGFRVYDVRPSDEPCKVKSEISIHDNTAENRNIL